MLMLVWLENHLIVLGLLAIVVGLGLGAVLAHAQRNAGRITDSRRGSAASSEVQRESEVPGAELVT
jgi:type III secretory pathway component EscT